MEIGRGEIGREGGRQAEWKIEREGVIYWSEGGK